MAKNPLSPEELFSHIEDSPDFHVPKALTFWKAKDDPTDGHILLPQPFATKALDEEGNVVTDPHTHGPVYETVWQPVTGSPVIDKSILPLDFVFTRYMAVELIVAVVIVALFSWLARQISDGSAPKGRLANLLESFLVFMRDQVVYNAIGRKDGDRFLPLIWSIFFFVLGCNLSGMIPWMGSPTGVLAVTGAMALVTFGAVLYSGVKENGLIGFAKAQVPHMEIPGWMAVVLFPMIWLIEVLGLLIKHFVLAIRLLANMMAGHLILAVIVGFIGATASMAVVWWGVMPVSVLGATAISVLELFVAFLQAYIFAFLSALFIGAAVHPH